jgi:Nucleotidyltransferase domain.
MAKRDDRRLINKTIHDYIDILKKNGIQVWRIYLYGSYAKGTFTKDSDIDLAIFLDVNDIDGFEEDALLMKLRRKVNLNIEPHTFAKSDFDRTNPFIKEIITTGVKVM